MVAMSIRPRPDEASAERSAGQSAEPGAEHSDFWRVPGLAGTSFFKASFVHHSYSRHTHDEYAIGTIEHGRQTFHCRGGQRVTTPGSLILVNPDDLHDGRSAGTGYRYRMVYIEPALIAEAQREADLPAALPLFRSPVVHDPELAAALCQFNRRTERPEGWDALEIETRLLQIVRALLQRHAASAPTRGLRAGRDTALLRFACRYLDEHYATDPSLSALADQCGISRFALLRLFAKEVGMPPHAYMTRARLREARRLLLQGEPAAQVAAAVGYVDQSHLTKRFKAAFGITPGQFGGAQQACR
jgi:AraC-like DNA-binding protein